MKRIIAIILTCSILMAMMLTGCGTKNTTPSTSPSQSAQPSETAGNTSDELEPATISVWYTAVEADPNDLDNATMTKVLEGFAKKYPQITIEKTVIGGDGGSDYRTKLTAEIASGNVPDAFMVWPSYELEPYVKKGVVKDLTDLVNNDPELSRTTDISKLSLNIFDGKLYAISAAIEPMGLFYNKKLFADNNLQPPKTIDELLAVAEVFKSKGITPVALGNSVMFSTAVPFALLYADKVGYDTYMKQYREGGLDLSSKEAVEAMEILRSLVDAGVFTKDFNAIKPPEAKADFIAGNSAMFLQGSWQATSLNEGMGENVGYIPFPTTKADNGFDCYNLGKGFALSAVSEGAKAKAAEAFLKYMYSEEMLKEIIKLGIVPAFKGVDLSDIEFSPVQRDLINQATSTERPVIQLEHFLSVSVQTEFRKAVQTACTSGDIKETLKSLQDYITTMN